MITSIHAKKYLIKSQHTFIIKILSKQENPPTDKEYLQKAELKS